MNQSEFGLRLKDRWKERPKAEALQQLPALHILQRPVSAGEQRINTERESVSGRGPALPEGSADRATWQKIRRILCVWWTARRCKPPSAFRWGMLVKEWLQLISCRIAQRLVLLVMIRLIARLLQGRVTPFNLLRTLWSRTLPENSISIPC